MVTLCALVATGAVTACGGTDESRRPAAAVRLSEIFYDPAGEGALEEFVEIINTGAEAVAMAGWCIEGLDHCFAEDQVVAPGSRLVVSAAASGGRLANEGERIALVDADGRESDAVVYSPSAPWSSAASGRGSSLHRVHFDVPGTDVGAWVAGLPTPEAPPGPPGMAGSQVVINEIMYHATNDDPRDEFIELLNTGEERVDVSGWCLREAEVCLGSGASIRGDSRLVISGDEMARSLDGGGGVLTLVDGAGNAMDTVAWDDSGDWPALADGTGLSLQRRDPRVSGLEPGNWSAAEPTRGRSNRETEGELLPTVAGVTFGRSPAPGEPVVVRATPRNGTLPVLHYVVDFGDEESVPMLPDRSNRFTAAIPGQVAGSLVRFRITLTRGDTEGSWPREGDGARYAGTVVTDEDSMTQSDLPRLQWFMPDEVYEEALDDLYVRGDDGYPAVFAFDGEVFDNATIRVKGQNSKVLDKKKWKVTLPKGHRWDGGGLFPVPVDEFALHSMSTDRAMANELLSYEVQRLSGGISQQVLPLRLERKGDFYGLYLYVEQDDATWRERHGFSDDTIVYEGRWGAQLPLEDLFLDQLEWRRRYRRSTHTWVPDTRAELAALITALDPASPGRVAYAYRHIDIPSVVEAIATMRITQNLDWGRKNWLLMYDPEDEKWRLQPVDHDLSFGRAHKWRCSVICTEITATPDLDYFQKNALGRLFLEQNSLRSMVDARTRTLADAFYAPGVIEGHLERWARLFGPYEARDRELWPTFGDDISVEDARRELLELFVAPKREMIRSGGTDDLPRTPVTEPSYEVTRVDDDTLRLRNLGGDPVDLSGRSVEGLWGKVPAGVVAAPGQTVVFERRRLPAPRQSAAADGSPRDLHVWVP